jgi:hypothetical protein
MESMTRTAQVRTPRQFLDRQQKVETHRLLTALQSLGDNVERLTDVEQRVRRHPLAACGVAAGLGLVVGPRLLPALSRVLGVAGVAGLAAAQRTTMLHALLPDALRERVFGSERRMSL